MIRAKQPNVVISCFKTETSNALVQNLRCRRLGSSFHYDPRGSKQLAESGLSLIRVNAFHPSYAINYNPEFSCFKRLLVLEFTKAFALWRNDWNDLDWMSLLRYECKGNLKRYVSQILNELLWNRFILAEVDNSCDQFLKRRWATLLGNLATDFEKCFFSECGFSLVEDTRYQLLDSNITWICCDIALVLEHFYPDGFYQHMSEKLLHHFRSCCY